MRVIPFSPELEAQVVELILEIQRGEFGIDITEEQQPDLGAIPSYYQTGAGNFWVALVDDCVIGTISLLDIGSKQAALRKMFVHADHRGAAKGTAYALLRTLLSWAETRRIHDIFLGTAPVLLAAHRFYEKHGFSQMPKARLPTSFPIMEIDTKFYHLRIPE